MMNAMNRPEHGSRRVASWVYEVINPCLEAISIEISFLERGNATWRFPSGQLEHLRPVQGYLTPEGRHVLRDFLKSDTEARAPIERHDTSLENLRCAAGTAHKSLMERQSFVQRANDALKKFMISKPPGSYPGGAFPEERFPELVAERVTNSVAEVPSHYTDADFWRQYGPEFLKFGEGREFERLADARRALLESDHELVEWLEDKSFELCSRYDLPAAHLAGSFE